VKRRLALGFLAFLALAVGGALALLSTPWAGNRLCALAESKVRSAAGVEVALGACRIQPLRLSVQLDQVRVGPEKAPIFSADQVSVRLAPLQALSRRIALDKVTAIRPRVALVLPPRRPGEPPAPCPPPFLEQFHVRLLQVEDGSVDLSLPGGERVIVGRVDVHTRSEWRPTDLGSLAAGGRRSRVTVDLGPTLVEAGGRQTLLQDGAVDADFAFDMSRLVVRDFRIQGEGVRVAARGAVSNLCKPRFGLDVSAEAPLPALFSLLRARGVRSEGTATVQAHLSGPVGALDASGELSLSKTRVNVYAPGDAKVRFRLKGQQVDLPSVEIPFSGGGSIVAKGTLQLGSQPTLSAEAQVKQVQFAELVSRFGLQAARVMMKLDAQVRVQGPLKPFRLTGEVGIDANEFRVIDHSWERWRPGEETILDLPRGRVEAPVVVTTDGVEMREGSRVRAGADELGVTGMIFFDDRGFRLAVDGTADLSALRHIASVPMAGHAHFQGTVEAQPYGPPHVQGTLRARVFHFLELDLGEVAASVQATPDLVLRVRDGQGQKGESRYTVETTVDLGSSPIRVLPSRATAQGRLHDLFDIVAPWLPPARLFQEAIDGSIQLDMPFQGPIPQVDMGFEGTLGKGSLWGRSFDSGRIGARVEKGERAVIERAELRRGEGRATGGGTLEFKPPSPWDMKASFSGLKLAGLDLPGDRWTGTAAGAFAFSGSVDEPVIKYTATGDGVGVLGVPIGAVQVEGVLKTRDLTVSATTAGVSLTGRARLEGAMPYQAEADIDVEDLTRFLPGGPPAGLRAQAKGKASAQGTLRDLLDSTARLDLSRIRVGYADFRVNNKDAVSVGVDHRRLEVRSFTLQGVNTEFSLTGQRERDGALDFAASGGLDLRLLGGLVPALVRTHGQLTVDARVSGTFEEPSIVGGGRIAGGGFHLKELPIEFANMTGDVSFSQNLVVFERLDSTVNGAPTRLRGELALSRFVPTRVRVEGDLDRVPLRIPSYLPTEVSGQLEAYGSLEAMTLSGILHVLSARYTERFDLEKRVLSLGGSSKAAIETRAYDPSGEWLKFDIRLVVDGDAQIDNDLVRGKARGELVLTGTLASFGLVGTLSMLPGGRAFFKGNEFTLSRAVLEFTDRRRIHAALDVTGEATARSQNIEYRVFLHVTGDLDDPRLQLSSSPALSQQDIITLFALGYTSRDTNVGGGIGTVAGAAAAQALFAVSGIEQQLRRFVPQTGVFQDVSVRLTSAYSPVTLTVEPRWEFETKALDSRLRIRYQAPLSNQSRGQKAQVEYRLNDRASLQAQWDNDNIDVSGGDLGADFKLRWEWSD